MLTEINPFSICQKHNHFAIKIILPEYIVNTLWIFWRYTSCQVQVKHLLVLRIKGVVNANVLRDWTPELVSILMCFNRIFLGRGKVIKSFPIISSTGPHLNVSLCSCSIDFICVASKLSVVLKVSCILHYIVSEVCHWAKSYCKSKPLLHCNWLICKSKKVLLNYCCKWSI